MSNKDLNLPRLPTTPRKAQRLEIMNREAEIFAAWRKLCPGNFMVFAKGLTIASQKGPRQLQNCVADFQLKCFEDIAPALHKVRDGEMPHIKRWWIERTKKASKDADLAVIILWLVCFPRRPFYMQVGAANMVQAAIVKERIVHLLYHNPWLNEHVEVVQKMVRSKKLMPDGSPMAHLDIMSSDISGAHGGTPDVLIVNELSHVNKWEFVENLMDNADGVDQGLQIIATNAGYKGSPAEKWRQHAIAHPEHWCVHVLDRPAPWHSAETIKEARQRNPESRFKRLWKGIWTSGKGDALSEEDIDSAFDLLEPHAKPLDGWLYLLGLDLGIKHDHAGLVVLGVNVEAKRIETAFWKAYSPHPDTREVDLRQVREDVRHYGRFFKAVCCHYDPHQAALMAQDLRADITMREMIFSSGKNLTLMAQCLITAFESKVIHCYDDSDGRLRGDLSKINIVDKTYGYKIEAVRDEYGHADVAVALSITLPSAVQMLGGLGIRFSADDILYDPSSEKDLTEEEVANLPDEFQDLFEEEKPDKKKRASMHSDDPFGDID